MEKLKTKDVLKIIGIGGIIVSSVLFPGLPYTLTQIVKPWKNANRSNLGQIIKRLERQDLISIKGNNNQTKILITEKGKQRLLQYNYENLELKDKKMDGKWKVVIFDIPENKKRNRDAFRKKLIELGFIRLQDSVFASPYNCKNEIDFLCHFLLISDFVTLFVVDKVDRGEKLFIT